MPLFSRKHQRTKATIPEADTSEGHDEPKLSRRMRLAQSIRQRMGSRHTRREEHETTRDTDAEPSKSTLSKSSRDARQDAQIAELQERLYKVEESIATDRATAAASTVPTTTTTPPTIFSTSDISPNGSFYLETQSSHYDNDIRIATAFTDDVPRDTAGDLTTSSARHSDFDSLTPREFQEWIPVFIVEPDHHEMPLRRKNKVDDLHTLSNGGIDATSLDDDLPHDLAHKSPPRHPQNLSITPHKSQEWIPGCDSKSADTETPFPHESKTLDFTPPTRYPQLIFLTPREFNEWIPGSVVEPAQNETLRHKSKVSDLHALSRDEINAESLVVTPVSSYKLSGNVEDNAEDNMAESAPEKVERDHSPSPSLGRKKHKRPQGSTGDVWDAVVHDEESQALNHLRERVISEQNLSEEQKIAFNAEKKRFEADKQEDRNLSQEKKVAVAAEKKLLEAELQNNLSVPEIEKAREALGAVNAARRLIAREFVELKKARVAFDDERSRLAVAEEERTALTRGQEKLAHDKRILVSYAARLRHMGTIDNGDLMELETQMKLQQARNGFEDERSLLAVAEEERNALRREQEKLEHDQRLLKAHAIVVNTTKNNNELSARLREMAATDSKDYIELKKQLAAAIAQIKELEKKLETQNRACETHKDGIELKKQIDAAMAQTKKLEGKLETQKRACKTDKDGIELKHNKSMEKLRMEHKAQIEFQESIVQQVTDAMEEYRKAAKTDKDGLQLKHNESMGKLRMEHKAQMEVQEGIIQQLADATEEYCKVAETNKDEVELKHNEEMEKLRMEHKAQMESQESIAHQLLDATEEYWKVAEETTEMLSSRIQNQNNDQGQAHLQENVLKELTDTVEGYCSMVEY
ncbi:hypothetical protein K490DRAFT_53138 [Saccharata proteae CBS 121410]|uniref:Uncharacterized protein n=1 Tax=Saccharata proteae CBS 121410 TaxID=1314787 RepID=A0A9P4LYV1_9PEZI|nr:hypothetical protein K490DRAFT_53138 [Saccharata proteae CBS 121410]